MAKKTIPAKDNLFSNLQEETELDAIQSLLRRTVSGQVSFKINPYDAKNFFDLGRVLIFLIDTYRDFEKDDLIFFEEGLHRVYTKHSRLAACSYGCEIGRGLATNDSGNGHKFFYCTTTHDLDIFRFAIEGVIEQAKVYLKETFKDRDLADISADYHDIDFSDLQKNFIENLYLEHLDAQIAKLKENQEDLNSRLTASLEDFHKARKAGLSTDEIAALRQKGAALDEELSKVTAEIEKLEREKIKIEYEIERRANESKTKEEVAAARCTVKTKRVAEKILDKLKVQIMPSTECVEMNEIFSKMIFNRTDAQAQKILTGETRGFYEKKRRKQKNGKVKNAIVNFYSMKNAEGYDDTTPLDEFDRAVLGVIVSEYLAGNSYTTIGIIYRALIGKPGQGRNGGIVPYKNQKEAIINSVIKLMSKIVDFSKFTEAYAQMKYTDKQGNELKFGVENLLSAGIVDAVVNGQEMEGVIYFKDQSPLFDLADAKNQVIRYPHELLNVPNQNNTPLVITMKKYVMRRICEIKLHKNLTPTITFADVFKKCRVNDNDSREQKRRRRNYILEFVAHLQEKEFIKSFAVFSKDGSIHGITFTF